MTDILSQRNHILHVLDEELQKQKPNEAVVVACQVALRVIDNDQRYKDCISRHNKAHLETKD